MKNPRILQKFGWIIIIIIILLVISIRLRFLQIPLERDEGEYAYAGQLILGGIPPYHGLYNMKMPGIYIVYASIMAVFGQTIAGIHLGLLVANITTIILLYSLGKKLFNSLTGILTSICFAVLSLNPSVHGIFANAEHFLLLPVIGGILLLIYATDNNRPKYFFWSGLLLGIGFVIKQPGISFIIFAFTYLFFTQLHNRLALKLTLFSIGALLPFVATCCILLLSGVFRNFLFWTFLYALEYTSCIPVTTGLSFLKIRIIQIFSSSTLFLALSLIGLSALAWNKKIRPRSLFTVLFFLFSFLSICPTWSFKPHYFILLLPSIALLASIGITSIGRLFNSTNSIILKNGIPILIFIIAVFQPLYTQSSLLFQLNPETISRSVYGPNPFPESIKIAQYIKEHSTKNDKIAVIGSEPQIYFYSKRLSATGYVYTYPLMETQKYALKMQHHMIEEIEHTKPKFLIFINIHQSWLTRPESEKLIFNWFMQYKNKHYKKIGIIDINPPEPSIYCWGSETIGYSPRKDTWICIYERRKQ